MDRNGQLIHFGERNITLDIGNREAYPYFEKLGKALSSSVRVEILDLLRVKSMSVVEIANKLNIPVSSTAFHINCLEQAGLVITKTQPGMRGSMRISVCSVKSILISTSMDNMFPETQSIVVDMPVGHFYNCDVAPTCGMADENGLLNVFDNPKAFILLIVLRHNYCGFKKALSNIAFLATILALRKTAFRKSRSA